LEATRRYQATFNGNIAYQKKISFTVNLWKDTLAAICELLLQGSIQNGFMSSEVRSTPILLNKLFLRKKNVKILKSRGSSGPFWLSPRLNELVDSIMDNNLRTSNEKYAKFDKQ
jgi:hypothetical protein